MEVLAGIVPAKASTPDGIVTLVFDFLVAVENGRHPVEVFVPIIVGVVDEFDAYGGNALQAEPVAGITGDGVAGEAFVDGVAGSEAVNLGQVVGGLVQAITAAREDAVGGAVPKDDGVRVEAD